MRTLLYWSPRVLAVLYTVVITIFALDIFSQGFALHAAITFFLLHLLPTGALTGATITAWHKEKLGGILFLALGIAYLLLAWNRFPVLTHLITAGPLLLIGILFIIPNKLPEKTVLIKAEHERIL